MPAANTKLMHEFTNSITLRWPSGPLEAAIRQKKEGFTAQARQALEYWHAAPALDIVQGSPVNCLVVSWAAGLAQDAEQQRTIRPLVDAAMVLGAALAAAALPLARLRVVPRPLALHSNPVSRYRRRLRRPVWQPSAVSTEGLI